MAGPKRRRIALVDVLPGGRKQFHKFMSLLRKGPEKRNPRKRAQKAARMRSQRKN